MKHALRLFVCLLSACACAEEFSFEATEFEKKPLEFGGALEFKPERSWLNRDGAFYKLNFYKRQEPDTLDRNTGTLKLNGKYTQGIASLNLRADAEVRRDNVGGAAAATSGASTKPTSRSSPIPASRWMPAKWR